MAQEKKSAAPEELLAPAVTEESAPPEEVRLGEEAVPLGAGYASRIDLDYIMGSSAHCFWASVGSNSYPKWLNAAEITTIAHLAFIAPKVFIQYNSSTKQIERIRPIKTFS
jgi:hypothetical protein